MKKLIALSFASVMSFSASAMDTGMITSHVDIDQVCSLEVLDADMNLSKENADDEANMASVLITNNKIGGTTNLKTDDVQFKGISARLVYKNDGSGNGQAGVIINQQAVNKLEVANPSKSLNQKYFIGHQTGEDFESILGAGHHTQQINFTVICE